MSGTEQEADPGPRQPLPGCISARLHEQHVPTWAGAVCSVALTAPATDNAAEPCRVAGSVPRVGGLSPSPVTLAVTDLGACLGLGKRTRFLFFTAEEQKPLARPWSDHSAVTAATEVEA